MSREEWIHDRNLEPPEEYGGPGVYEFTYQITTSAHLLDRDDEADALACVREVLTGKRGGDVELISMVHDPDATREYVAATRAEALEDHWKGVEE